MELSIRIATSGGILTGIKTCALGVAKNRIGAVRRANGVVACDRAGTLV